MTPGDIWHSTPYSHHRKAIFKALRVDPSDPSAGFACACFRVVADQGVTYIAGAVGCPPHLNLEAFKDWTPDAISDVVLWNPRTNDLKALGEAKSQAVLIAPTSPHDPLTVYQDGFAFFRAWLERRSEFYVRNQMSIRQEWVHPNTEPSDSLIPGALIIGKASDIKHWPYLHDATLVAGAGCDESALKNSVWRSAHIPQVITRTQRKVAA